MAVDTSFRQESLSLYHFMCQHIVGTEEVVRTKRLMLTIQDNLEADFSMAHITSGSFGEGLEMKGSDLDQMHVFKDIIVHEDEEHIKFDPEKLNLVMEMKETKPGFALLRCVNSPRTFVEMDMCRYNGKAWYMSSSRVKSWALNVMKSRVFTKIHGPCLSNNKDTVDYALCVHNPNWIQPAANWIHRGNTPWPVSDVKSDIIDHGVLFVPIGCKGSDNEAMEWRISFSVAEKLLTYSFCHTQLLCYTLMKILLKDLINIDNNCNDLLCSYFIKTIIFWVSEETEFNEWKPTNLIRCFMKCFRRLMYTIEYSICPHYFMPTINMFENKIVGQSQRLLLDQVQTLFSFGWGCVLFSEQFHDYPKQSNVMPSNAKLKKVHLEKMVTSKIIHRPFNFSRRNSYGKCIGKLNKTKSSFIKSIYVRYLSTISQDLLKSSTAGPSHTNKSIYYQYRKEQTHILQNVYSDAATGWLFLATVFYNLKQYSKSSYVLNYVLMKYTPDKMDLGDHVSLWLMNLVTPKNIQRSRILRIVKHCVMNDISFTTRCKLIPEELALDVEQDLCLIHPVVFAIFLRFMCHFHQNDRQQCYKSIRDLMLTIDRNTAFIAPSRRGMSYSLLGIALQFVGQNYLAEQAFTNATKYDYNGAERRLMMMHTHMI